MVTLLAAAAGCSASIGDGSGPPSETTGTGTGSSGSSGTGSTGNTGTTGGVGTGTTGSGGSTGTGGSINMDPPASCKNPSPGSAPIRRLTRFEYSNTIRDLLGDTTQPGDLLPAEVKGNGFSNDAASATSTRLLVDAYHSVAHDIAARATARHGDAEARAPATPSKTGEEACAQAFIDDFGARAFRHPLESAESAAMMGIYKIGRQGAAYADGLAAVIEMALAVTAVPLPRRVSAYRSSTRR